MSHCHTVTLSHSDSIWGTWTMRDNQKSNKTWQRDTNMTTDQLGATQGEGWSSSDVVTQWYSETPLNCPHHLSNRNCLGVAGASGQWLSHITQLCVPSRNMKIYRLKHSEFLAPGCSSTKWWITPPVYYCDGDWALEPHTCVELSHTLHHWSWSGPNTILGSSCPDPMV